MLEAKIDKVKYNVPATRTHVNFDEYAKFYSSLPVGKSFTIPRRKAAAYRTSFMRWAKNKNLRLVTRSYPDFIRCWITTKE